jgi:hypothetical protein
MRLCKLSKFRSHFYAYGSEPSMRTLRSHIDAGKIPGGRRDHGRYFVDLDEWDRAMHVTATLEDRRRQLSNSPDLEGLI